MFFQSLFLSNRTIVKYMLEQLLVYLNARSLRNQKETFSILKLSKIWKLPVLEPLTGFFFKMCTVTFIIVFYQVWFLPIFHCLHFMNNPSGQNRRKSSL